MSFSFMRTLILSKKEILQIIRDPSSFLIAVVIPLMLLLIFAYGVNLDSSKIRIGIVIEQPSQEANNFMQVIQGSPYFTPIIAKNRNELSDKLSSSNIRGMLVIPSDFAKKVAVSEAQIQLITDGSEPNIANFVQGYVNGAFQTWQQQRLQDSAQLTPINLQIETRYWFNSSAISRNYILPGAITIIMTVIGSILTSLVIAREWERGTMEALLSTPMTRLELILSKLLPYYLLAMIALIICMAMTINIIGIPFRGSFLLLFIISTLFLFTILSMGLLISTITKNQFNAASFAINIAFLPSLMLSGYIFEINNMPTIIQWVTYLIPARYYVTSMQTLFLTGNILPILLFNAVCLMIFMVVLFTLILRKTKLNLD